MPFYAGLHECAAGPGGEQKAPVEVDESKILCMSCGNDGKFKCPKNHGDEFVVWKCRYVNPLFYTLYTPFIHLHYHIYTYVHPLHMYIHHIYT